ncbi:hypothetical protein [Enterobacter mori]|uniref:hypothetical protein n=1 Tax=Enterobacter mori TaxID=539813 RepID=UPI001B8CFEB2|nr:hypothetical protein [Enterobacter mori]MBS3048152.1 hypothetical protein [Enterobacter mori]
MKPSYEELEEQLNRSRRLCDAALANERVWEIAMMQACGEDGPKSVADKFAALEKKLAESQREFRAADATIENMQMQVEKMAAELNAVEAIHTEAVFITDDHYEQCPPQVQKMIRSLAVLQIPAYQAFLAEVRAQGVDVARNAMIDFVEGEVGPNENVPGLIRSAEICVSIAAQLRKGVQS